MAIWSAENATKAYLKTLKMGNKAKGPDVAEYISALAAGNNSQLMVFSCASPADSTILALVAAAHQTGGRVVCILPGLEELSSSEKLLGTHACHVEFVIGNAQELVLAEYREADFVVIDCKHVRYEEIHIALDSIKSKTILVGYNAFCKGFWKSSSSKTQLLPIGGGLLVTRITENVKTCRRLSFGHKSQWVVKVDKCTGEEHVFRVRSPLSKQFEAHQIHTC